MDRFRAQPNEIIQLIAECLSDKDACTLAHACWLTLKQLRSYRIKQLVRGTRLVEFPFETKRATVPIASALAAIQAHERCTYHFRRRFTFGRVARIALIASDFAEYAEPEGKQKLQKQEQQQLQQEWPARMRKMSEKIARCILTADSHSISLTLSHEFLRCEFLVVLEIFSHLRVTRLHMDRAAIREPETSFPWQSFIQKNRNEMCVADLLCLLREERFPHLHTVELPKDAPYAKRIAEIRFMPQLTSLSLPSARTVCPNDRINFFLAPRAPLDPDVLQDLALPAGLQHLTCNMLPQNYSAWPKFPQSLVSLTFRSSFSGSTSGFIFPPGLTALETCWWSPDLQFPPALRTFRSRSIPFDANLIKALPKTLTALTLPARTGSPIPLEQWPPVLTELRVGSKQTNTREAVKQLIRG